MKRFMIATIVALALVGPCVADEKPSDEEAAKLKEALAAWGCEGGSMEKESEGSGVFEVDDTTCRGAQYDAKFESDYSLRSLSRD